MRQDFVIIGSGISGMTAALLLARQGYKVTLVEKFQSASPTVRGFSRQGVYFDTGLHYTGSFAPGEILDVYFKYLGLKGIVRAPFDPHCFDRLRYPKQKVEFQLPVGYEQIQVRLCENFPREAKAIRTYLADVRKNFEHSPFLNLEHKVSVDTLESPVTLETYLNELTNDRLLKSVLGIHALLYGVPPQEIAFSDHAKIAGSYYQSVHGIVGGGLSVVRAFEAALEDSKIEVRYGNGAKQVQLTPAGKICGLILDDNEIIETDQILSTIHPAKLLELVPDGAFRPTFSRRLRELVDTPSAYMLFGISEKPLPILERSNLFVCPETDVDNFFQPNRLPEQGPWYLASTKQDSEKRGVVVIAPGSIQDVAAWKSSKLGKRSFEYRAHKQKRLDHMRTALLKHVPELESVRFVEGATPLTLRDYMNTPTGSLYGIRHTVNQFNPAPATRIPGLLLAGQSIVAPGLLGAVISAFLTCGFIIGHNKLRKELRACN
ncbi:all-trans-retinol 13,14-reductase [Desulfomicrobium norvegicum]|uniref:All-trans-retinol 13,14-reductase n=1 Tax=Desulfomicrobium norvegicum (strain DSM 1741 / NCIMB 8310) TaxID=52561 RepID=A0A8G2C4D9_DESNO|nr:NAD(P)/FAD-dependent oxidoreductase [Desulfomicrobium norvegicum]SFL84683.1 all-trans-retinol 13,14-reductase [Desulfomicrobium norvegicum]